MKKLLVVHALLSLLFLVGCSNDGEDTPDDQPPSNPIAEHPTNFRATGSSANDYLSNARFNRLIVEIAYVSGFRPNTLSMQNFETFLRERTFKEEIEIRFTELPSPGEETLTLEEISDLEIENRTAYNDGSTLATYIYFANAPSDNDDESEGLVTLGAVYRNTSMVIYGSTIRRLGSINPNISITDIETGTLNHEFGHLFGLVDLGTPPVNDHEDPDAENHCVIPGCLMRAEIQFNATNKNAVAFGQKRGLHSACNLSGQSMLKLLQQQQSKGATVPDLDAECILDLQSNGGR